MPKMAITIWNEAITTWMKYHKEDGLKVPYSYVESYFLDGGYLHKKTIFDAICRIVEVKKLKLDGNYIHLI